MERKLIGTITKPQALKGEFRLKPTLLNLKKYKKLTEVYINNTTCVVESVSLRDTFVVMKLKGIDNCNDAEKLRNTDIYANIEDNAEQSLDLLNYIVVSAGQELGVIVDINNYGSKDIISVSGQRNLMFPLVDGLVEKIAEDRKIYLNVEILDQVAVYED